MFWIVRNTVGEDLIVDVKKWDLPQNFRPRKMKQLSNTIIWPQTVFVGVSGQQLGIFPLCIALNNSDHCD